MTDPELESYACKPDECRPDAHADPLSFGAEWFPQSKTWAWTCPHGRLYSMGWHGVISLSELREAIGLRRAVVKKATSSIHPKVAIDFNREVRK